MQSNTQAKGETYVPHNGYTICVSDNSHNRPCTHFMEYDMKNENKSRKEKEVDVKEVLKLAVVYGLTVEKTGNTLVVIGEKETLIFNLVGEHKCQLI